MRTTVRLAVAMSLAMAMVGCGCGDKTRNNFPQLEVPLPGGTEGQELTTLDFGLIQVGVKAVRKVHVRNSGTAALNFTALTTAAPFGTDTMVPSTLEVNAETDLLVTFTPATADQHVTGKISIGSDDPQRGTYDLALEGQGVTAVARTTPNPLAFGDVYVKESKTLMLTLTNAGGNELPVQGAMLTGALAGVTADFAAFTATVPGNGGSATVAVTFAPTATGPIAGAVVIHIDAVLGGDVSVPITGRGTAADPRLCFRFSDTGTETCTDPQNTLINVDFGSICDNAVYPADAGAIACTPVTGARAGTMYVRNDGLVPVKYSMQVRPQVPAGVRCDGGSDLADITFSNGPDGGAAFNVPTSSLPGAETDPRPWETAPVVVSYRATSRCRLEASDQAQVLWTRQGDPAGTTRPPGTLVMTLVGSSRLPSAKEEPLNLGTQAQPINVPLSTPVPFTGVVNQGNGPLVVKQLKLYEEIFMADLDGGTLDGGGPLGGFLQPCNPASSTFLASDCARFNWDTGAGGNPAAVLPVTLDAGSQGNPGRQSLGRLFVGCYADGGSCPGAQTRYRVYAVIDTSDPYAPQLTVPIEAWVKMP